MITLVYHLLSNSDRPPGLVAILTPANLFTGVLACGIICLLSLWTDRRNLPVSLRQHWALYGINLFAGIMFISVGIKAYWDHSEWIAFLILGGTIAAGWGIAFVREKSSRSGQG